MKYPFQELKRTNSPFSSELMKAAERVIASGWYINGEENRKLNENLVRLTGCRYAQGVACGLDAIQLILHAYMELERLKPGDEVIIPANTFVATFLPVERLGLRIVPVEPDSVTMATDFREVEKMVTDATRCVIAVHLYGTPSWDFGAAKRLRERGIVIIEDNAQAIGASVLDDKGEWIMTGNLGDAAAFSFYPGKNIGALGDAGAVTTSDEALISVVRKLSNYGSSVRYHHELCGYNSRLDEIQAAFLNVKLPHIEETNESRRRAASVYLSSIRHPAIELPASLPERYRQVWHQFVVRTPHRDRLQEYLAKEGVGTLIHYPIPPHLQKCYEGRFDCELPLASRMAKEVLSLPIADITPAEAIEISDIVNRFVP